MSTFPSCCTTGLVVGLRFGVAFIIVRCTGGELVVGALVLDLDAGVMPDFRGWVDLCGFCLEDRGANDAGVIGMAGSIHGQGKGKRNTYTGKPDAEKGI